MKSDEKTPYHDENGQLYFPLRPLRDIVFLWPISPKKLGRQGLIHIPESLQRGMRRGEGIVLAVGPGYWDKENNWNPTTDQLKPGALVMYDKTVPWSAPAVALDGKEYNVVMCGSCDIYGVLE